jgi:hypothetical protein
MLIRNQIAQSWPQKRKAIIIAKYMEDSVVKSVDILLKDNLIRNLKKKLHQNQTMQQTDHAVDNTTQQNLTSV